MARKKKVTRKKTVKKKVVGKKRLVGFTKVGSKFALVFKRGKKLSVGRSRFSTKKTLVAGAKRVL